jgi:hypothetical protein
LLAVLSLLAVAEACNVPVFRFALERWRSDPYEVVVFHRGPLSDADREVLRPLEEKQDQFSANIVVRTVDVDGETDPADKKLLALLGDEPALPRLVLQYPHYLQIPVPVWHGPLSRESVASLTDSPIRKELVRRLASGQTAVWLVLECGDAEKDEAAVKLLTAELSKLEKELELPELSEAPEDNLLAGTPLKLQFTSLRVTRGTGADEPLVQMLVRSEPDLADRKDPMIFPIFGRGRALFPLIGAGITAENIYDSGAFLVGACSCEVKELNPGFDLLLSAEWDTLLFAGESPAALTNVRPANPTADPVLVPIPGGSKDSAAMATPVGTTAHAAAAREARPANRTIMLVLGGGFAIALFVIACCATGRR